MVRRTFFDRGDRAENMRSMRLGKMPFRVPVPPLRPILAAPALQPRAWNALRNAKDARMRVKYTTTYLNAQEQIGFVYGLEQ